jgi:hypothetical protein
MLRLVAIAGAAASVPASAQSSAVEAPAFQSGSHWVFHITSKWSNGESALDLQWTLLYMNKQGQWVFARRKPDRELPANLVPSISGVTDVDWSGRDSTLPPPERSGESPFPLAVGKQWRTVEKSSRGTSECMHRAVAWEDQSVRAGSFKTIREEYECYRVGEAESLQASSQPTVRVVRWYSPEVQNVVKEDIYLQNPPAETHFELSEFKLAGKQ